MPRGGRRPGAGRPKKGQERQKLPPEQAAAVLAGVQVTDAKVFLERVMAGLELPTMAQMDAARSLLPFQHKKLGETGKKEQRKDDAGKVGARFSPAPPRLVSVAGKKV
jgi:phage terminase small subunit